MPHVKGGVWMNAPKNAFRTRHGMRSVRVPRVRAPRRDTTPHHTAPKELLTFRGWLSVVALNLKSIIFVTREWSR